MIQLGDDQNISSEQGHQNKIREIIEILLRDRWIIHFVIIKESFLEKWPHKHRRHTTSQKPHFPYSKTAYIAICIDMESITYVTKKLFVCLQPCLTVISLIYPALPAWFTICIMRFQSHRITYNQVNGKNSLSTFHLICTKLLGLFCALLTVKAFPNVI